MSSTFLGLEIGKRSLMAHQQGLKVIGHNLSNADNEDYSRQKVILGTVEPLYRADLTREHRPGQVGQGVQVMEIRRERDIYLDQRIFTEIGKSEYWKANEFHLNDIEKVYNALGDTNLQERMDIFWAGWQEVANNPSEASIREDLLQKSLALTSDFRDKFEKIDSLRNEINEKIIFEVREVNNLAQQIADLNKRIYDSQIVGDNPNDLLDRRDSLITKLAAYGDLQVSFKDPDETRVFFGGRVLVQGMHHTGLRTETDPANQGLYKISWMDTGDQFTDNSQNGGSIVAHLYARDTLIAREISQLDTMATNLIFGVNNLHRKGFDENGRIGQDFFTVHPSTIEGNGNADVDADGVLESSLVYQVIGNTRLQENAVVGSNGTITLQNELGDPLTINYFASESIKSVIEKINNSDATVNALLDQKGQLIIKSRSYTQLYPFALERITDSGDFLSNTARLLSTPGADFQNDQLDAANNFHPQANYYRTPIKQVSSWIAVAPKVIANSDLIAARAGENYDAVRGDDIPLGKNNGENAMAISNLRHDKTLFDRHDGFNEFYVATVAQVGSELHHAQTQKEKFEAIHSSLREMQLSYSGVNIDEELANMVAMQNSYQAGARIVKLMDEMLQTLLGLVG